MVVKFDQHFLDDKLVLEDIVSSAKIGVSDVILEIGCGKGVLTKEILSLNPREVVGVEIDDELFSFLEGEFEEFVLEGLFKILNANVLDVFDEIEFTKIVANIPYAITEPLFKKILDRRVECVTLLFGNEFYKKIVDAGSKWHYLINSVYDVNYVRVVEGDKFTPSTKTTSVVCNFVLKGEQSLGERFVYELFVRRKRSVRNACVYALVEVVGLPKRKILKELNEGGFIDEFDSELFENVSNGEFVRLFNFVSEKFF